jgi:anti-sigma factor RsiW
MTPCAQPIDLETLIAYWLGELADEAALEEHLMGCEHCAQRLEALAATAQGIRATVQSGALGISLTPRFLQAMKDIGMRIREYPAVPGETINCTITAQDDAVVSRLKAPLAGVGRLDALHSVEIEGRFERWRDEDVPFDPEAGEVLLLPAPAALRKMPAHIWRMQLVVMDEAGERRLAEYTFAHTPS